MGINVRRTLCRDSTTMATKPHGAEKAKFFQGMRTAFEHIPRSRLFVRYLTSYLLILAISVGISLVSYLSCIRIIEAEIARAHYNSLVQLKNIVDTRIMELEQVYIQVGFDERTLLFMGFPDSDDPTILLNTAKVIDNLRRYKLSNPLIAEIYLHSFRKGQVLNDNGKYEWSFFLEKVFPYPEAVYRSWVFPGKFGLSAFSPFGNEYGKATRLVYIRPFPVEKKTELTGALVIVLDEKILINLMSELRWISESKFFVVDEADNLLLENGDIEIESIPRFDDMRTGGAPRAINDLIVTAVSSDRFNWRYVAVIPKRIFFERAARIRNMLLLGIIVLGSAGMLLAYLLARRQYSPMGQLIRHIQGQVKDLRWQDQGEYTFILSLLNRTLKERKEYLEGRSRRIRELKHRFLLRILRGEVDATTVEQMKGIYSLDLDDRTDYCVILQVFAEEPMPFHQSMDIDDMSEERQKSTSLLLINTMDRLLSPGFPHHEIETEDVLIFIVGVSSGESPSDLNKAVSRAVAIAGDNLKIPVSTAVSAPHRGYAGLASAYKEADETMEILLLTKRGNLLFSQHRQSIRPRGARYDFRNKLEQLLQNITIKDFDKAGLVVDSIFAEFLEENPEAPALIRYRMDEVIHTFINAVEDLMIYYNAYDYEYSRLASYLPQCRSIEDLRERLHSALAEIRVYIESTSDQKGDLQGRLIHYINTNYSDVSLNVSTLAHIFEVPVSHVSRLVKKVTGVGALEYLQLLRIEQAKKLLRESDSSIRNIIKQIGFASEVSFIRVFKKMEAVTPGAYRKKEMS
jgi:two-component system response regulator YesN